MAEHDRKCPAERPGDATASSRTGDVEAGSPQSEVAEPIARRAQPTEDWWFGELAKFALKSRYVQTGDVPAPSRLIEVVETGTQQSERQPLASRPQPIEDWWFGELAKFALKGRYLQAGNGGRQIQK
jgi:hypothetical protein